MSALAVVVLGVMYLADKTVLTMTDLDAVGEDVSSLFVFAQDDESVVEEEGASSEGSTTRSVMKYSNGYIEYWSDERMCTR